ncbi:hypothetical protein [Breznakiella homolactica]|uniref:Uncharacterized protein n=1 Tax=Breznakiella homolactica TaxID=2798577 RepID=A0A7T7XMP3_9SPIR|nr:hypothetical protein [Breznakiella homolactica]QQO09180.1 hypothetical protein JFL75_19980 [Breznakiella homolactica]
MYKLLDMKERQKEYISKIKKHAAKYLKTIDKTEIETILLSGSVSRGDYFPSEKGGMIDLIVMRKENSKITAEKIFGKDQDPYIPYHCIKWNGEWFAILFGDFITSQKFRKTEEARKYALLESQILYDESGKYKEELASIESFAKEEQKKELEVEKNYIQYVLSKEKRWEIREAYSQMHQNLNTAINQGIRCLYYKNNKYAPAEDRRLYYSYELDQLPENYEALMIKLMRQEIDSKKDYERRKKLFTDSFMAVL